MMRLVDFETTTLIDATTTDPHKQPGIVQIGVLDIRLVHSGSDPMPRWEVTRTINQLIDPEKPASLWDPKAIEAHKLTPEDVVGKPTLLEFLPTLAEFFVGAQTWVGFNNWFDKNVLWYQLLRYGWEMRFPWPMGNIDVMLLGKDLMAIPGKQDIKPPSLIALYEHFFGVKFEGAHDALNDCMATFECFKRLVPA